LEYFRYEYRWADGVQIKKPIEVSAPKYVEYLMDWIEAQLDDESIFPQKLGEDFNIFFHKFLRFYDHPFHFGSLNYEIFQVRHFLPTLRKL